MGSSASAPRVQRFEKDKVYLFAFPSNRLSPSFSPFALKVETWLRLREIDYEAIRSFDHWSSKGQVPFVELNGEEINDSSCILRQLGQRFDKRDPKLSDDQEALAHMVTVMLDNHTFWTYMRYRILDEESDKFFSLWEGLSAAKRLAVPTIMRRKIGSRIVDQGIGRNLPHEIYSMGCDDIRALSGILGDKNFLIGDEMTSVDCAVFGHLAQMWYTDLQFPQRRVLREEAANLVEYLDRIRDRVWPDWDEFCAANVQPSGTHLLQ